MNVPFNPNETDLDLEENTPQIERPLSQSQVITFFNSKLMFLPTKMRQMLI